MMRLSEIQNRSSRAEKLSNYQVGPLHSTNFLKANSKKSRKVTVTYLIDYYSKRFHSKEFFFQNSRKQTRIEH